MALAKTQRLSDPKTIGNQLQKATPPISMKWTILKGAMTIPNVNNHNILV